MLPSLNMGAGLWGRDVRLQLSISALARYLNRSWRSHSDLVQFSQASAS